MSDELSTDCETRARARAWIKKFDDADGRYLSQKKRELAVAVTGSQEAKPKEKRVKVDRYSLEEAAIGRWRDHFIRSKAVDCEIGDCFVAETVIVPAACDLIKIIAPSDHAEFLNCAELEACSMTDIRVFLFKRVTFNLWQRVQ